MKLSVIIPCYNSGATLATQLDALVAQDWPERSEVIISDNGSTDDSRTVARRYISRLPSMKIVDASGRRGAAHARNVGANAASSDALVFVDADDEVGIGWLAAIREAFNFHDCVASRFDPTKLNSGWTKHSSAQQDGLQKAWYPPYFAHAGGCGLGIKRSIFQLVGGFDESLPRVQDTDLCFRLQLAGVKIHYEAKAVVHTRHRHTLSTSVRQIQTWAKYNVLLYKRFCSSDRQRRGFWKGYLLHWIQLLEATLYLRGKPDLYHWIRNLAWEVGLLHGIVRFRALPPPLESNCYNWHARLRRSMRDIRRIIPNGTPFILVDDDQWEVDETLSNRLPFFERDGQPWKAPPDDTSAIDEVERHRKMGVAFIVFGWPAFWWFDCYFGLTQHLRINFRCVFENKRLVIFDLLRPVGI